MCEHDCPIIIQLLQKFNPRLTVLDVPTYVHNGMLEISPWC